MLRLSNSVANDDVYAVVECKRADPTYVSWLFGAREGGLVSGGCVTLCVETKSEHLQKIEGGSIAHEVRAINTGLTVYDGQNWAEVKSRKVKRVSNSQTIEDALTQVVRGLEGLAKEHTTQRFKNKTHFRSFFLPIVVTTAKLYVAAYERKNIDIDTGTISKNHVFLGEGAIAEEIDWVRVDYGVGENVAPDPIPNYQGSLNPTDLQDYKSRSVFIVNSGHLVNFFSRLRPHLDI